MTMGKLYPGTYGPKEFSIAHPYLILVVLIVFIAVTTESMFIFFSMFAILYLASVGNKKEKENKKEDA